MLNWKQDLLLAPALFGIAAAFFLGGRAYPGSSFLFPSRLAPILALLAILLACSALKRRRPGERLLPRALARGPLLLVSLTAVFILVLPYVGFIPSCFFFSLSFYFMLGYADKKAALLTALCAALGIWAVFHLALGVALPAGSLWAGAGIF